MIILRKLATQINSTTVVVAGVLSGNRDGSNTSYTTTYNYKPDRISVFINGQALHTPEDFYMTGANEISLKHIKPEDDDVLRATYEIWGTDYMSSPVYGVIAGKQAVTFGASSQYIDFGTTLSDTSYKVNIDLITNDLEPSIYSYVVGNKTTAGCTVKFSGDVDATGYVLDWVVLE